MRSAHLAGCDQLARAAFHDGPSRAYPAAFLRRASGHPNGLRCAKISCFVYENEKLPIGVKAKVETKQRIIRESIGGASPAASRSLRIRAAAAMAAARKRSRRRGAIGMAA